MSSTTKQSNLEIVKGAYDAFARSAVEGVTAVMAEDIKWFEPEGGPNGGSTPARRRS